MSDQLTVGLDSKRVKVIRAMPNLPIGRVLFVDDNTAMTFRCNAFGMHLLVKDLIRDGWVEEVKEVKEESLASKMGMTEYPEEKKYWELRAKIANEHYQKEVMEAINIVVNGTPIPVNERGMIDKDHLLESINRVKELVSNVFKANHENRR